MTSWVEKWKFGNFEGIGPSLGPENRFLRKNSYFMLFFRHLNKQKCRLAGQILKCFSESYKHNNFLQFPKFHLYSVKLIFQKYDKKIRKNWKNIENLKFNYQTRYEKTNCGKWKSAYNSTKVKQYFVFFKKVRFVPTLWRQK